MCCLVVVLVCSGPGSLMVMKRCCRLIWSFWLSAIVSSSMLVHFILFCNFLSLFDQHESSPHPRQHFNELFAVAVFWRKWALRCPLQRLDETPLLSVLHEDKTWCQPRMRWVCTAASLDSSTSPFCVQLAVWVQVRSLSAVPLSQLRENWHCVGLMMTGSHVQVELTTECRKSSIENINRASTAAQEWSLYINIFSWM